MRIDILTLFPETVNAFLHESILGRAAAKGLIDLRCTQIRDYTDNRQNQVDDYPYGGGFGCVMMAQPLKACLEAVKAEAGEKKRRVIYLSPQGRTFDQTTARRLAEDYDQLILVCGHYEGVDERFIEACVDEEISLGDFVMTGGEIAAMAVADAVCRLVPGVLSDPQCYIGESHWDGLLEYPQYTRPENWEGRQVPQVLLDGDHARVERWRRKEQLRRTREKRPDLFEKLELFDPEDRKLLEELKREEGRKKLSGNLFCREATEEDMADILRIVGDARASLRRLKVDQWQGDYPAAEHFLPDLERHECCILQHEGETAAFFTLSLRPESSYDAIRDGKWSNCERVGVLHRAAVAAAYRGSGLSEALMRAVEERAEMLGCRCIRTDTHRKNKPMQRLLRESGYRYRGNITISCEPGHDTERQAFEKLLKKRESRRPKLFQEEPLPEKLPPEEHFPKREEGKGAGIT